jgi:hypothetical protein
MKIDGINEITKNNTIHFLKIHLPAVCFRGDNYSTNFVECLDNSISKQISNYRRTEINENNKKSITEEIWRKKSI